MAIDFWAIYKLLNGGYCDGGLLDGDCIFGDFDEVEVAEDEEAGEEDGRVEFLVVGNKEEANDDDDNFEGNYGDEERKQIDGECALQ